MAPHVITREELKTKIDRRDDFVLIETLPPPMFDHAHLPGAINIPPEQLQQLASRFLPDKNREIIVYCAGHEWPASRNAARDLAATGYKNVREYPGGKAEWIKAGGRIEGDLAEKL